MKKITHYYIVDAGKIPSDESFSDEIQKLIEQGWQPYGPPFARKGHGESAAYLCQAMVKYDSNENNPTENRECEDCGLITTDLITKGDHHGGIKIVCRDRDACHRRSP